MQSIQQNILQTGKTSQSAVRVAIARAVHQLLDDPIVFEDSLAFSVLGHQTEEFVRNDPFQFNDPPARTMRAAIVARSRLAEDELQKAVNNGVKQYVVLGAGLDTFCMRNPYQADGLRVFEIDHPAMQEHKRQVIRQASITMPDSTVFVPVDFESDSLAEKLREAGFRVDEPAYFSWLGVTVYLSNAAVLETLSFVAKLPKRSGITFDYRLPVSLLNPIEKMMEELGAAAFAALGEPWVSAFEPAELQQKLIDAGFTETAHFGPTELNTKFFQKRKDGLQTGGGGFRFLCAYV